MLVPK